MALRREKAGEKNSLLFKKVRKKPLTFEEERVIIRKQRMQVSPSGMAAASQAVPGEFDSRHLLQVSIIRTICLQQANGSDFLFVFHPKNYCKNFRIMLY